MGFLISKSRPMEKFFPTIPVGMPDSPSLGQTNDWCITGYTNHNAMELINHANTNRALLNWEEELTAFWGIFVLMDIVKLPASQLYRPQQTQDDRLHKRGITGIFPRDLFDYILKYFYYNTSENVPHKDNPEYKLYQVKPDLEELSKKFLELYDPHSHRAQSIDEAMIKFKTDQSSYSTCQ